jgi:pilus assembly protein CpaF
MTQTGPRRFTSGDIARLKEFLIENVTNKAAGFPDSAVEYQQQVDQWLEEEYSRTKLGLDDALRERIFREVRAELVGYGPIEALLAEENISEVMVYGPKQVYVERDGRLEDTNIQFKDDAHLMRIINRMLHPVGRRVDLETPTADARLPDGSRVNVVIPPIAVDGPCITIRKFLKSKFTIEQLIEMGSLTPNMAEFLQACVVARLNIIITGNTSSGKTTLLNILTGYIPGHERIITIEDAAELQLKQKYVVRMETRPANVDGKGSVITRDLVRNALRMRPDRIVVGEVRSGEALDMLQAMNTGHDGSLTTLHANAPRDAISRLETMAMMAGLDMPLVAIRTQIASAIDLIVHMDRLTDGARKVVRITEVPRMEGDVVTLSDLFRFDQTGVGAGGLVLGEMRPTGLRPMFTPRLEMVGYKLRGEIFGAGQ